MRNQIHPIHLINTDGSDAKSGINGLTTILNTTTIFGILNNDTANVIAFHVSWDASITATITFEDTCFPDVTNFSVTAGEWIKEDPTTAYIAFAPLGSGTAVNMTITIPGGTAGGAMVHFGNTGSRRTRVKIVTGTGGAIRVGCHGRE